MGFVSGETSVESLLQRKPQVHASELVNALFEAMLEVRAAQEPSGKSMVVFVTGHADRDLTPGRSEEERRQIELTNSRLRMESVMQWMTSILSFRLGEQTDSTNFADHIHIWANPFGAASWVAPSIDEVNRQRNRRVTVTVSAANVEAVNVHDGKLEVI